MPLDVVWEILVVMFLIGDVVKQAEKKGGQTHLVSKSTKKILDRLPIVFSKLAKVFDQDLIQTRMPATPNDVICVLLQLEQGLVSGFPAHDLETVRRILEEG